MKTEYEVRFLEVDENEILRNLKKVGVEEIGNWQQIRYVHFKH